MKVIQLWNICHSARLLGWAASFSIHLLAGREMMKLPTPFLYPGKRLSRENNDKSTAHMTNCFISNAAEDYEH